MKANCTQCNRKELGHYFGNAGEELCQWCRTKQVKRERIERKLGHSISPNSIPKAMKTIQTKKLSHEDPVYLTVKTRKKRPVVGDTITISKPAVLEVVKSTSWQLVYKVILS